MFGRGAGLREAVAMRMLQVETTGAKAALRAAFPRRCDVCPRPLVNLWPP